LASKLNGSAEWFAFRAPGFVSLSGDRMFYFVVFLRPSKKIMDWYLKIGHDNFSSILLQFIVNYSSRDTI
jgi:hypothetical protein